MQAAATQFRALRIMALAGVKACRDALVAALNGRDRIRAEGYFLGAPALFEHLERSRPDVIVVDVSGGRGLETITALRGHKLAIPVIALGVESDATHVIACAEAGAAGYVLADASLEELIKAIDDVLAGRLVCPPAIAFDLFRTVGEARPSQRPDAVGLTPREQEVLRLLGRGQSNKEIARSLGIAVSTVKNHVHHILEKSDACSRRHAALKSPFMLAPGAGLGTAEDLVRTPLPI